MYIHLILEISLSYSHIANMKKSVFYFVMPGREGLQVGINGCCLLIGEVFEAAHGET